MAKGAWTYLHLLFSALCYLTYITIVVNGDSSIASLIDETFEHQTQVGVGNRDCSVVENVERQISHLNYIFILLFL